MPHLPRCRRAGAGSGSSEPGAPAPRDQCVLVGAGVWLPQGDTVERHQGLKKTRTEE